MFNNNMIDEYLEAQPWLNQYLEVIRYRKIKWTDIKKKYIVYEAGEVTLLKEYKWCEEWANRELLSQKTKMDCTIETSHMLR